LSLAEAELLPINTNPTDIVLELRKAILEVLDEREEERTRSTAEAAGETYTPKEKGAGTLRPHTLLTRSCI
jgi:hypothetical protein